MASICIWLSCWGLFHGSPGERSGGLVALARLFAAIEAHPLIGPLWSKVVKNPKELERFFKFAIVGISGAVVDFTVLNLMKWLFERVGLGLGWGWPLEPYQIQLTLANTISFSVAVLNNFTWNRLWTFPESREQPIRSQLAKFAIVNVVGWGINTLLLLVMDRYVFQHFVSARLSYNLAKAIATIAVLFWNFGINRVWTYKGIK